MGELANSGDRDRFKDALAEQQRQRRQEIESNEARERALEVAYVRMLEIGRLAVEQYSEASFAPFDFVKTEWKKKFMSREETRVRRVIGRLLPLLPLGTHTYGTEADFHQDSQYLYYDVSNDRLVTGDGPGADLEVDLRGEQPYGGALFMEKGTGLEAAIPPDEIPETMANRSFEFMARVITHPELWHPENRA